MMKILYDHQAFSLQNYGGITRSFYEIMSRMRRSGLADSTLALKYTDNQYVSADADFRRPSLLNGLRVPGRISLTYRLNQMEGRRHLRGGRFDVFHPTYYDPYFLKHLGSKPFVLTIHDMIHELFPAYFPKTDKIAEQKKILAGRAAHIIAVSENSKKDIIRLLNIKEDKITVIHHGSSFASAGGDDAGHPDIPSRFILFVGNRPDYKNFKFCVQALAPVLKQDSDLRLVCVGGGFFSDGEKDFFSALGIKDSVMHFSPAHTMMARLYARALVFVFPSLYEGFGIPVLEAFSCGCPVILSRSSSLPEVGGDAAVYFDPKSEASLQSAVKSVIEDETKRLDLKRFGLQRLKEFSWDKTARQTAAVYQKVV